MFRFGEKHLRVRLEKKEANVESLNSEHLQTGAKSRIIHFRIWEEKREKRFFPEESYKCFCEGSGRGMLPGKIENIPTYGRETAAKSYLELTPKMLLFSRKRCVKLEL